jgi:hypothetical protein
MLAAVSFRGVRDEEEVTIICDNKSPAYPETKTGNRKRQLVGTELLVPLSSVTKEHDAILRALRDCPNTPTPHRHNSERSYCIEIFTSARLGSFCFNSTIP